MRLLRKPPLGSGGEINSRVDGYGLAAVSLFLVNLNVLIVHQGITFLCRGEGDEWKSVRFKLFTRLL